MCSTHEFRYSWLQKAGPNKPARQIFPHLNKKFIALDTPHVARNRKLRYKAKIRKKIPVWCAGRSVSILEYAISPSARNFAAVHLKRKITGSYPLVI